MNVFRQKAVPVNLPPLRLGMLYRFDIQSDPAVLPVCARSMDYPRVVFGMRDVHYHLEFGVNFEGRLRRHTRGFHADLSPGEIWYCGIWEPHGIEFLECPNRHLLVSIQPRMLAEMSFGSLGKVDWFSAFNAPPPKRPQFPAARRAEGLAIAERMAALSRSCSWQDQVQIQLLFLELMLILQGVGSMASPHVTPSADAFDLVGGAVHMLLSARGSVNIRSAARALGASRQTLGRQFQRLMNMSFSDFALNHRLGMAAGCLLSGRDSVKAIALDWGFKQTSHFDRCFRAHFGCSPQQYRRCKV